MIAIFLAGPIGRRFLDVRFVAHCGRKSVILGGPKSAGSDVGSQYAETILF
jgi:hypothetical protein